MACGLLHHNNLNCKNSELNKINWQWYFSHWGSEVLGEQVLRRHSEPRSHYEWMPCSANKHEMIAEITLLIFSMSSLEALETCESTCTWRTVRSWTSSVRYSWKLPYSKRRKEKQWIWFCHMSCISQYINRPRALPPLMIHGTLWPAPLSTLYHKDPASWKQQRLPEQVGPVFAIIKERHIFS